MGQIVSFVQSKFTGGEISQAAQGDLTHPAYKISMNVCLNWIPLETGSLQRRPGTRHAAQSRGGGQGKLISFAFEENFPYQIALTDGYMRFTTGPGLVMTNDAQAVVSISAANPAVVRTTTAHGWTTGNPAVFNSLGSNNPLLQNRQLAMTVVDSTHVSLTDAITGATIDGSTLGTFVSGNITRILEIATSYIGIGWQSVRSIQAEKQAVLVDGTQAPQVLSVTSDPSLVAFASFSLTAASFVDGPYLDPVAGGATLSPSAATGIVNMTVSLPAYLSTKVYTIGDFAANLGISYQSLIDQNVGNTPAGAPTAWKVVSASAAVGPSGFLSTDIGRAIRIKDSAANWTWGRITSLLNKIAPGTFPNVGTMTLGGGLASAFDGVIGKVVTSSAYFTTGVTFVVPGGQATFVSGFVGKNFSTSPKIIKSATYHPSTDAGFGQLRLDRDDTTVQFEAQVWLRAKQTPPVDHADGTILGQIAPVLTRVDGGTLRNFDTGALAITSNDTTTAWNYVWLECVFTVQNTLNPVAGNDRNMTLLVDCAQAEFFSAVGTSNDGVAVEILGPDLATAAVSSSWRLGVYSDTTGWPTCGAYHEGRLWLSGAVPNRFDAGVSNGINGNSLNFAPTAVNGQVLDSSAISYTLLGKDVNALLWMEPDQQGIICGTQAGEWLISAPSPGALTPTNIKAVRVTKIGCANIEPKRAEHTLLMVQKFGRKVMEYFADVFSGKLSGPNLSERAKHLTVSNIQEIAYQQELAPICWARLGDGGLIGATYKRNVLTTNQEPNIIGWHRHTLGSGRLVESICVGPSVDGNLDALSLITADASTGDRHIEVMTDLLDEGFAMTDCWYLDDAIVPSSTVVQNGPTGGPYGSLLVNGLWAHNGKTVTAFIAGLDCGDYTVTNGSITVPFGDSVSAGSGNGLFTAPLVNSFTTLPALVGFSYDSDGQIVRPLNPTEPGLGYANLGRSHRAAAFLYGAINGSISFGSDFSEKLDTAKLETPGGRAYTVQQPWSGIWRDNIESKYDFDGMIAWRVSRPWPAFVMNVKGFNGKESG